MVELKNKTSGFFVPVSSLRCLFYGVLLGCGAVFVLKFIVPTTL